MDPITIAMAASKVVAAIGNIWSGYAQADAMRLNSEIAKGNVDLLSRTAAVQAEDAPIAIRRGTYEQKKLWGSLDDILGGQLAHFRAAGIDASTGTPLTLAVATMSQAAVDSGLIASNARYEQAGAFSRAASTQQAAAAQAGQAYAFAERANDAIIAGWLGGASAMLQGGATAWKGLDMPSGTAPTPNVGGGTGVVPAMPPAVVTAPASIPFPSAYSSYLVSDPKTFKLYPGI